MGTMIGKIIVGIVGFGLGKTRMGTKMRSRSLLGSLSLDRGRQRWGQGSGQRWGR